MSKDLEAQIVKIERQIADLKARLPRHSIPPAMLVQLEDMEVELARLKQAQKEQACG